MIAHLRGKLVANTPLTAVVDCAGVGYEVFIPLSTANKLPSPGEDVHMFISAVYREDSQTLYGFHEASARDVFRLLIEKVPGVGPRLAISLLSTFSVEGLRASVAAGDVAALSRCPGVGRKTAERLLVELRDKAFPGTDSASPISPSPAEATSEAARDAIVALQTLGYKANDAAQAVAKAQKSLGEDASTETLIKGALGG